MSLFNLHLSLRQKIVRSLWQTCYNHVGSLTCMTHLKPNIRFHMEIKMYKLCSKQITKVHSQFHFHSIAIDLIFVDQCLIRNRVCIHIQVLLCFQEFGSSYQTRPNITHFSQLLLKILFSIFFLWSYSICYTTQGCSPNTSIGNMCNTFPSIFFSNPFFEIGGNRV